MMGYLLTLLSIVFVSVSANGWAEIEQRAIAKTTSQDFNYRQRQLDTAVSEASETVDEMFRRLEIIENNQKEVINCARQDAPVDPDSYSIWDNGRGKCVTVTRGCVPRPTEPIESRELVFIFDASSSMKETYNPPKVSNDCEHYYTRYQKYCGSKYYPSFYMTHPVEKQCGKYSTTKYCQYCGSKPSAPRKKVVIGTKVDGEGIPYNVYGYEYITSGKEWDDYQRKLSKYNDCYNKNEATQCMQKYNQCKSDARIELQDEINAYNEAYAEWKVNVYDVYSQCRNEQYQVYKQCVNDFNAIWNTAKSEPRITAAKKAVKEAIVKAPTFVELGLVVFNGCQNVKNHGFYLNADRYDLLKAVDAIDATGSTPLVDSMIVATENMKIKSESVNAEGYIVLVTDGEETCVSQNSTTAMRAVCDTAKALKKKNDGLVINVMDLSNNSKLSCISEYTGGVYASVSSESTMLSAIVGEMSKISDVPEYCYAPTDVSGYGTIDVYKDPEVTQ